MARMRAIDAAVAVLRKEGIDTAFGIPGAAINPLYSALRADGGIRPPIPISGFWSVVPIHQCICTFFSQ